MEARSHVCLNIVLASEGGTRAWLKPILPNPLNSPERNAQLCFGCHFIFSLRSVDQHRMTHPTKNGRPSLPSSGLKGNHPRRQFQNPSTFVHLKKAFLLLFSVFFCILGGSHVVGGDLSKRQGRREGAVVRGVQRLARGLRSVVRARARAVGGGDGGILGGAVGKNPPRSGRMERTPGGKDGCNQVKSTCAEGVGGRKLPPLEASPNGFVQKLGNTSWLV